MFVIGEMVWWINEEYKICIGVYFEKVDNFISNVMMRNCGGEQVSKSVNVSTQKLRRVKKESSSSRFY